MSSFPEKFLRFQVLSDLHAEFMTQDDLTYAYVKPDAVLLAGDIAEPKIIPKYVNSVWGEKGDIFAVAGNHEYYHNKVNMDEVDAGLKENWRQNVFFLQNEVKIVKYRKIHAKIIGATLWTDYALYGDDYAGKVVSSRFMADHYHIREPNGLLVTADELQKRHFASRKFLEEELSKPFNGPVIVLTHHCPSQKSIDERFANFPGNAAFASNLDYLFEKKITLWVHGHTHASKCYLLNETLVVCNPRGYRRANGGYENLEFDPDMVIVVFKDDDEWKARKEKRA